ncbi:hypothetical protein F5J12DRAFT_678078, partial [Pisolithus orientalis]|uniref:uncharacterized protein n=1 Tax=Pisolithus orientalis TaxID=936130 RepID=UPI002224ABB6
FDPISLLMHIIAAVLHLLCGVSMDHCTFILSGLHLVLKLSLLVQSMSSGEAANNADSVPQDIRSVVDALSLSPVTKEFVCCPKCFSCYPLESFPERCTNQDTPSSAICQRLLQK